jgi:hypothetical protein
MAIFSPSFDLPCDQEARIMQLDPDRPGFAERIREIAVGTEITDEAVAGYAEAIRDARACNVPIRKPVLRADDLLPDKNWGVLAAIGYMCDDPYTGARGVEKVSDGVYKVVTRLATRNASSLITFTFRLMESLEEQKHVFSPLLVRFLSGVDHTRRAVKISDSGRIRNELQTMFSQALDHDGDRMTVHFDRVDEKVMPRDKQAAIRRVLEWYKANHPVWFRWLEIA